MKAFLPLIINAAKWCKPVHHAFFTDILLRLLILDDTTNGTYDDSRKFKYFPALFTLYAIGITAVKNKDYFLLQNCFTIKFSPNDSPYSSKKYIIDEVNSTMLDSKVMRIVIGHNYITPISTYLNKNLRSYFSDIFYTEVEFNDSFDVFEYILSLNYLSLVGGRHGYDWAPWGEYVRRRRNIYNREDYALDQFNNIADTQKESWDALQTGMFNKSFANFQEVRDRLEEFLKGIHDR
jgi:hypothetical protein